MIGMDENRLERILAAFPERTVAVIGDFCVDRYLEIDPGISDTSNETGLPIHQVSAVRAEMGGAANVVANLAALGVGRVLPVGLIGDDGTGFELRCLLDIPCIDCRLLHESPSRPTPAFIKPLVLRPPAPPEELRRFDVFPRTPLTAPEEDVLLADLRAAFGDADILIVADYGEAGKEGVVTPRVREALAELGRMNRRTLVVADSRLYIDKFRHALIKPNRNEATAYLTDGPEPWRAARPDAEPTMAELIEIGRRTAERNKRPVLITLGAEGILLCASGRAQKIPAYPAEKEGEIDAVGAGDAVLASLAAALAAGAALDEAAMLGMVVASVTIQQIGRCGTASPDDVRRRFAQYAALFPDVVYA